MRNIIIYQYVGDTSTFIVAYIKQTSSQREFTL